MQQINLYLPQFRQIVPPFAAGKMVATLIIGWLGLGGYGLWLMQQGSEAQLAIQQLTTERDQKQNRNRDLAKQYPEPRPDPALVTQRDTLNRQIGYRQQFIAHLQPFTTPEARHPFSTYLHGLARQDLESLWLTSIQISARGNGLTLKGATLDADALPIYIQRLNREPPFSGITLDKLTLQRGGQTPPADPKAAPRQPPAAQATETATDAGDDEAVIAFQIISAPPTGGVEAAPTEKGGAIAHTGGAIGSLDRLDALSKAQSGAPSLVEINRAP